MTDKPRNPNAELSSEILRQRRNLAAQQQQSYRQRALRLLPHICASCGREFSGKRLKELTVHHKDHDFTNNPPDGSNWELLCLYCHDHEHEKHKLAAFRAGPPPEDNQPGPSIFSPFEGLDSLLKDIPLADEKEADDDGAPSKP